MSGGNLLGIFIGLGTLLVAILGLLVVRVDEHSALARIWAWLQLGRKEREALKRRIIELEERLGLISAVVQKESDSRVAQHDEIARLVADLKQRVDADGKRLSNTEGNILHDAMELEALGAKQKQLEAQLASYGSMLTETRDQITDLRRADARIAHDASDHYLMLEERLSRIEQSVGYLMGEPPGQPNDLKDPT